MGAKIWLGVFNFLSVFIFSGAIFGWTALQDMLVGEGYYLHLCEAGEMSCDAQTTALNRAFTYASTAVPLIALPFGLLLDKVGPHNAIWLVGLVELVGLVLFAVAASAHIMELFVVSFVLIALGGAMTLFTAYTLPFLFPDKASMLIGFTSSGFDFSSILFPILQVVWRQGVSFPILCWIIAAVGVFTYLSVAIMWMTNRSEIIAIRSAPPPTTDKTGLVGLPINVQMKTRSFVSIFLFGAIQLARANLYLGTVPLVNEDVATKVGGNSDAVDVAVSFIVPAGFLSVPLFTSSVSQFGLVGTMQVTNIIGFVYNALQFIPNLGVQALAAVVFTIGRAFLFAVIADFNAQTFGILSMGTIQGICFLAGAFLNLFQAPLVAWTVSGLDGNTIPMLLVGLCISIPLPIVWEWQRCGQKQQPLADECMP